jgi:catechol 2,3-dioxygenase-like lactoylglutathione lyase family enzyme
MHPFPLQYAPDAARRPLVPVQQRPFRARGVLVDVERGQQDDLGRELESPAAGDFTVPDMQTPAAGITRDIYGMPAFVTFVVADLARTVDWYTNGLDFIELFSMPGPDGPRLVHLRRWRYQDILVRPGSGAGGGPGGGRFSVMAGIEELDALAARAAAHGGGSVNGPFDTPWNTRDVHAVDPDGYTVVYTAHRPAPRQDADFNAMMVREARRQGLGG